jgi:nickel-type superoxide dismutase maturation protease
VPDALPAVCVVVVRGRSMLPTLRDGDRLLVRAGSAAARIARPGDLVVLALPGNRPVAVKRLVRRDGASWWVERDNPHEGVDSWQVGALPPDALLGVVLARVWPRPARLRSR